MRFGALVGMGVCHAIADVFKGRAVHDWWWPLWGSVCYDASAVVQSQCTRRQQTIIRALPDALDLMSICVEAGLWL